MSTAAQVAAALLLATRVAAASMDAGVVDVRQMGAKGDGIADDTDAIQAAVETGRRVYVPAGTYRISHVAIDRHNTHIVGDGVQKTVFVPTGATTMFEVATSQVELRDFSIDGKNSANYGIACGPSGCIQARFIRLEIEDVTGSPGIGLGTTLNSYSMLLQRLWIHHNNIGIRLIRNFQNTVVDSSLVYGNRRIQIQLNDGVGTTRMVSIVNSEIEGGGNKGDTVYGLHVAGVEPLSIVNCYFESFDNPASADIYVSAYSRITIVGTYSNANDVTVHPIQLESGADIAIVGSYYFNSRGDTIANQNAPDRRVHVINSVLNVNGGVSTRLDGLVAGEFSSETLTSNGGLRLKSTRPRPSCTVDSDGTFWFVKGGPGVKDDVEVCAKDARDVYAWRAVY